MENKKEMRVWHNSNFGEPAFTIKVESIVEAAKYLKILAEYDLYLGDKIDANAQGLEEFNSETDEWEEWMDDDGVCISEITRQE